MKARLTVAVATMVLASQASNAGAQSLIKQPGAHPDYVFEAEPHLVLRDRHGHGGAGLGPGFRGAFVIVDDGFISKINDSVGIGFGADWILLGNDHCKGKQHDRCHAHDQLVLPVVMQWNFWLHRKWSVFGEPGFAMILNQHDDHDHIDFDPFVLYAGGRYHFDPNVALAMRMGFPFSLSVSMSFLL